MGTTTARNRGMESLRLWLLLVLLPLLVIVVLLSMRYLPKVLEAVKDFADEYNDQYDLDSDEPDGTPNKAKAS